MPPRKSTSPEYIERRIHYVRGLQIMTDTDLATLYHVSTKVLLQAVKRNRKRFPADFMFQLNDGETENLRSQIVTSSWGGRRYKPYAFTEQGIAMLSSVLRSEKAIRINIDIMRAFVRLHRVLSANKDLAFRMSQTERRIDVVEKNLNFLYEVIEEVRQIEEKPKRPIGFGVGEPKVEYTFRRKLKK